MRFVRFEPFIPICVRSYPQSYTGIDAWLFLVYLSGLILSAGMMRWMGVRCHLLSPLVNICGIGLPCTVEIPLRYLLALKENPVKLPYGICFVIVRRGTKRLNYMTKALTNVSKSRFASKDMLNCPMRTTSRFRFMLREIKPVRPSG